MTIWSKSGVLLAASLVLGAGPAAQYQPTPIGAARMPEPVPLGPSQPLMAGPLTPLDAPPGPPSTMSLPADHTGAFQSVDWPTDENFYASIGARTLQRQNLGNLKLGSRTVGGANLDTGVIPTGALLPAQDLSKLNPHYDWGVTGTVGYLYGSGAFEFTGSTIFGRNTSRHVESRGNLNLPFVNPPIGFEGDNGMWLQADQIRTTLSSQMTSFELNYRYADVGIMDTELIMGIRYLDQLDQMSIFTDDDGLTNVDNTGRPDPRRQATYSVSAHNRLIAPQLGFEFHRGLFKYFSYGMNAKGAWGLNFADVNTNLRRGDGFVGLDTKDNAPIFSHMYDLNFFLEAHILERMKIRAGYNMSWLVQWATAPQNVNFDLAAPTAPGSQFNHSGSIFYQGPQVEFMFLF